MAGLYRRPALRIRAESCDSAVLSASLIDGMTITLRHRLISRPLGHGSKQRAWREAERRESPASSLRPRLNALQSKGGAVRAGSSAKQERADVTAAAGV
jgi:hypothetical protein